ncbi:hypothetical protein DXG03_001611 [Asterophora parasitica]|uniref:Uncharacterized protein n=1 Tax=Asterophora parasitica TaxID=117018 RepID=A0A9P7G3V2_9AGAR|nr:hypothetical protein DXG03_001611 [Asterophora parasitica]
MSNAEFPVTPLPMLLPEEQLASLESSMSTLLSTSQTTVTALMHVLALVNSTLPTASNSAAPAVVQMSPSVVQATAAAIPLPKDLSNLPAFLEAYKVQAAADAKQGWVAEFVAHVFQFSGAKKLFWDWDQFISIFADEFYNPNKVINALLVLELSTYLPEQPQH